MKNLKIDIIHSLVDIAGINIQASLDRLISNPPNGGWSLLNNYDVTFKAIDDKLINATDDDRNPDADLVIFISRHASIKPIPVLTVHSTGNYTTADLGGNSKELGISAPVWMHSVLRNLQKYAPDGYRVSYEVTHHGPTCIKVPSFFVEVGSTEAEWQDVKATDAVAKSVLMALPSSSIIPLIGIGGTHYAPRETDIALNTNGGFGHIMHTRYISGTDESILHQMINSSGAIAAYIDRKNISKLDLEHINNILVNIGILILSEEDLHNLLQMPLSTWKKFARIAKEVNPEYKLYPHGIIKNGDPIVLKLPKDLFHFAYSGNETILFKELDEIGNVFHAMDRCGNTPAIFFTTTEDKDKIFDRLIILAIKHVLHIKDSSLNGENIIITRQQFEPNIARTLGIKPGKLYGELASGSAITLSDGRVITPDMVMKSTQYTIHIPGLENYL